jgi:catechol 2,3-dioxygenase-like lactoylglutathione lyase family enzyme
MKPYVEPGEQLVFELFARDIQAAKKFCRDFGFQIIREEHDFIELRWESSLLFIAEVKDAPEKRFPSGNVRVMVPDVDRYWAMAQKMGVAVIAPIADRPYGLRDFTIAGPEGICLRFATIL